jgi:hypothetical protein
MGIDDNWPAGNASLFKKPFIISTVSQRVSDTLSKEDFRMGFAKRIPPELAWRGICMVLE